MSTLGRKAMKKTLEHLKKDVIRSMKYFKQEFLKSMEENPNEQTARIGRLASETIHSLITFIVALSEYSGELDEAWEKLLESAKQTKPVKKKEGSKEEPFYVN